MKKKNRLVFFPLLLGTGIIVSLFFYLKSTQANKIEEKKFEVGQSETESDHAAAVLPQESTDNQQIKEENFLLENEILEDRNEEPQNIQQAETEKEQLLERIKRENAVERLNNNTLTEQERQDYVNIYKRLSELDSYIYKNKIDNLSTKVAEYEIEHEKKLKELGIGN